MRQRDFRTRPTSASPLNFIAYAATRAGSVLGRTLGKTGFNSVRRLTGDALASQTLQAIFADGVILFPALDAYCCAQFIEAVYEPEVYRFLAAVRDEPYAFVDGGANLGYWSVQVSGRVLGSHPCVAIEPLASTFRLLELNRLGNGIASRRCTKRSNAPRGPSCASTSPSSTPHAGRSGTKATARRWSRSPWTTSWSGSRPAPAR